jgi:cysteine-rich repeat protein
MMANPDRRRWLAALGGTLIAVVMAGGATRAAADPTGRGGVCAGPSAGCGVTCGDGVKAGSEDCDDGNLTSSDGCSASCEIESGYHCAGDLPSVCAAECGDGVIANVEDCDDGNLRSGDGCSVSCKIESAWRCAGAPSRCLHDADGDGVYAPSDNCDQLANAHQDDGDGDGIGDACDVDRDGDGITDGFDVRGGGGCDAGAGGGAGLGLGLALAAALALRRRRSAAVALAVLGLVAAARDARAQAAGQAATEARDFDVERFHWSPARHAILGEESGEVLPGGAWDLGMWVGTADDALVVASSAGDLPLVSRRSTLALAAAYGIADRLELAITVPFVVAQSRADSIYGVSGMLGSLSAGLGDIAVSPKAAVVNQEAAGVAVAVIAGITLPTGRSDYRGDQMMTFTPTVAVSRTTGPFAVSADLGWRIRELAQMGDLRVDDELLADVGAAYQLDPVVGLELGLSGATGARYPFNQTNESHAELRGGATFRFHELVIEAIVGAGVKHGYGTPDWRGVLAARYER